MNLNHFFTDCGAIFLRSIALTLAMSLVAACGSGDTPDEENGPVLTAQTLGRQEIMTNRAWSSAPAYAGADAQRGELLSAQCRACHSLQRGGDDIIGPGLFGFFGKPAGRSLTFEYSAGLANGNFIWTPRALDAWLANPGRFLPGNKMAYAGLLYAEDRNALVGYLLSVTDDGVTSSSGE